MSFDAASFMLTCDIPMTRNIGRPGLLKAPQDDLEAIMRDQASVNRITMFLIQNHDEIFDDGERGERGGAAAAGAGAGPAVPASPTPTSSSPPRSPHRSSPPPPSKGEGEGGRGPTRQLTVRTKPASPATPTQPKPKLVGGAIGNRKASAPPRIYFVLCRGGGRGS